MISIRKAVSLFTILLIGATHVVASETDNATALTIAKERKQRDIGWGTTEANVTMVLRNSQGQEAQRELNVKSLEVSDDGDKALTVFNSPRDVKGTAFLSFSHALEPDEQWIYLPALKRVKRISSRNKSGPFVGSEFAFEDMTSYEVEKFSYEHLGEEEVNGEVCFVLRQTPNYDYSGYTSQKVWIDKSHYRVQKVEFYDKKNALLKVLTPQEYKLYKDKFWRPMRSEMRNVQTRKSTYLITEDINFDTELSESDFDKNRLKRAR
ncbi:outer membrane lipoprotein-sorting protein [Alteromonas genovensis]|uniref:Outer membrane lipoprotein-sorting protein n=1 Tax=Alteromonas genovensis TaxID=471225 RepID=A0A6N9TAD7_9ALTE|nr:MULTISPECIES: outer membrane lipoprotein-sorting protein [Alteromonas]MAI36444.1 outer membrane lipoprotein-sorting protein [Alteromonas sp.]NDW14267.1 outer membrane lipoprotein-sorting protein [Alteromonas genovensis]OUX91183.1 MAG: outer membrane lipoprotein-sorting protein [Alteromonas sp. TMED35]|tara:strand:- start:5376 stop:6170 length:795 start_codon:yes stop_codon:yes gene_type:complete